MRKPTEKVGPSDNNTNPFYSDISNQRTQGNLSSEWTHLFIEGQYGISIVRICS